MPTTQSTSPINCTTKPNFVAITHALLSEDASALSTADDLTFVRAFHYGCRRPLKSHSGPDRRNHCGSRQSAKCPKEIRGVYDRLKTLQGCLAQFETLLRSGDASSAIKAHLQRWDEVVKGLSSDANELLGTIQELHDKLGGKGLKKLQAQMGFVVDRDKIKRLEGLLSTHIETLELLSGTLNV